MSSCKRSYPRKWHKWVQSKFEVILQIHKYSESCSLVSEVKSFKTKSEVVLALTNLDNFYEGCVEKLLAESSEFEEKDSGRV